MIASELGLEIWGWSDDTRDWAGRTAVEMLADLSSTISAGSVVLMHDGIGPGALRTDPRGTIELVAPLVSLCRDLGLEPSTVTAIERPSALA